MNAAARREALAKAAGRCGQCRRPFGVVLTVDAEGGWQDGEQWRDWQGRPQKPPREFWRRACDACVVSDGRVLCRACCSREGGRPRKVGPKKRKWLRRRVSAAQLVMAWT